MSEAILSPRKLPNHGTAGWALEGTRELLHEGLSYIVAYPVKEDVVKVLHIWHPSQERR
jgi:hypothetical protein